MGDKTSIEWTDATWNPVRGCSIVSKGCTNCYAMKMAHRSSGPGGAYEGLTQGSKGGPVWNGKVRTVPELLDQPLRWARPRRIFVNSMSDLFHEAVPFQFIADVFAVMACTTRHKYQVLTKRPQRMLEWFKWLTPDEFDSHLPADAPRGLPQEVDPLKVWPQWTPNRGARGGYDNCGPLWPLENVWLGVSVEDQAAADERIPLLQQTPAAVRWLSCEPLLGPIEIGEAAAPHPGIQWVVAGGESGPGARPMHPDWARSLRDQCVAAGVPFFFKQWGNWVPHDRSLTDAPPHDGVHKFDSATERNPFGVYSIHMPKKAAGRQLDGRTHDEYPV